MNTQQISLAVYREGIALFNQFSHNISLADAEENAQQLIEKYIKISAEEDLSSLLQEAAAMTLHQVQVDMMSGDNLTSLFSAIEIDKTIPQGKSFGYPLKPLTPLSIFPEAMQPFDSEDAKALWTGFVEALKAIPETYRQRHNLFIDHLDSLFLCYAYCIPIYPKSDISLYDYISTKAAIATALWQAKQRLSHYY